MRKASLLFVQIFIKKTNTSHYWKAGKFSFVMRHNFYFRITINFRMRIVYFFVYLYFPLNCVIYVLILYNFSFAIMFYYIFVIKVVFFFCKSFCNKFQNEKFDDKCSPVGKESLLFSFHHVDLNKTKRKNSYIFTCCLYKKPSENLLHTLICQFQIPFLYQSI